MTRPFLTATSFLVLPALIAAFAPMHNAHPQHQQQAPTDYPVGGWTSLSPPAGARHTSHTVRYMAPRGIGKGDFEYEELKAQMKGMENANLSSDQIAVEKRAEIQGYVNGVLEKRLSPISLSEMGAFLPGSAWRLSFSTQAFSSTGLPRDATIFIDFQNQDLAKYSLKFGEQTLGLNKLNADCSWKCGTNLMAQDPTKAGVVTLTYDKITTDVFGFSNIGVGFFGMLQGRSTYIQTVYFDEDLWIEEGYSPTGEQYYNVYVRQK
uniref:Plastid lipid-associated protein/fibrillin conserved domain-containing protein n=1 Tax=Entomoneis paludosa TaxID=265537 RepID=A0A7S3DMU8_9STRA